MKASMREMRFWHTHIAAKKIEGIQALLSHKCFKCECIEISNENAEVRRMNQKH